MNIRTDDVRKIWESPDGQVKFFEVNGEYKVSTKEWPGFEDNTGTEVEVEVYTKKDKRGNNQKFIRPAGSAPSSSRGTFTDNSIMAQVALKAAVEYAQGAIPVKDVVSHAEEFLRFLRRETSG